MTNQLVARFADGRVLKGTSLDVDPKGPTFHLRTPEGEMVEVTMADLKALFFVRSLAGNPKHADAHEIAPTDPRIRGARLVEVTFTDGEKITALALRFPPNQPYFYLTPVDTSGNNIRILVNSAHIDTTTLVDPTTGSR